MSAAPPNDSGSPGQPRYTTATAAAPAPTQIIVQQPQTAFGRYGKLLIAALVIAVMTILGQAASYRSYFSPPGGPQEQYHSLSEKADDKIAIITIEGAILDPEGFVKQQIDRVAKDDSVVAVVLRIDSPGGTVTASDYLYHHLLRACRRAQAADGRQHGRHVRQRRLLPGDGRRRPADEVIFAEPTTWTGSIGVLIPHYDLSGLLARWDVTDDSIASHKDKLMGSPTRRADARGKGGGAQAASGAGRPQLRALQEGRVRRRVRS